MSSKLSNIKLLRSKANTREHLSILYRKSGVTLEFRFLVGKEEVWGDDRKVVSQHGLLTLYS